VHSTGHSAGSVAPVDGAALIRVLIDEPVTVDPDAATARIPAGTSWADVLEAIAPLGFGAPHGSSSHVGAVGYLLRGGLSFYGRARGVAVNSVESIELVTASGEVLTIDAQRDPELFWAVRGGGGGFGVVTAVTIRLFPLRSVVTGMVAFEADDARELARAWVRWAGEAPESITTSFRVVRMPGLPGMPRDLQGRPLVVVDGVAHASDADGVRPEDAVAAMLERLEAVAEPVFDSWRLTSPHEVPFTHVDPPMGVKHDFDHQLLRELGDDGADAFVDAALDADLATAELRQLGAALGRRPADGGALAHYPGAFASFAVALTGSDPEGARARLDGIRAALTPWDAGCIVPTFAPDASRPQRPLDADAAARARAIRFRVDPTGVFAGEIAAGA
jgi:FAD/FMN-containing dehydrogenase